jgi:hypothetical protein
MLYMILKDFARAQWRYCGGADGGHDSLHPKKNLYVFVRIGTILIQIYY